MSVKIEGVEELLDDVEKAVRAVSERLKREGVEKYKSIIIGRGRVYTGNWQNDEVIRTNRDGYIMEASISNFASEYGIEHFKNVGSKPRTGWTIALPSATKKGGNSPTVDAIINWVITKGIASGKKAESVAWAIIKTMIKGSQKANIGQLYGTSPSRVEYNNNSIAKIHERNVYEELANQIFDESYLINLFLEELYK